MQPRSSKKIKDIIMELNPAAFVELKNQLENKTDSELCAMIEADYNAIDEIILDRIQMCKGARSNSKDLFLRKLSHYFFDIIDNEDSKIKFMKELDGFEQIDSLKPLMQKIRNHIKEYEETDRIQRELKQSFDIERDLTLDTNAESKSEQKQSPPSKHTLLDKLKQKIWDADVVTAIIAAKRLKRAKKGSPLNCFVLTRNDNELEDELYEFLYTLKTNIKSIANNTRFQLAIQTGVHWTACDMMIKDGQPFLFILDAAMVGDAIKSIDKAFTHVFPNIRTYVYIPDDIARPGKDPFLTRRIQFDTENCATFALDHIFHLAITNVFEILENAKLKASPMSPNYFKISPANCPIELAFIFRNTQSFTVLMSLADPLKNQIINTKGFRLPVKPGADRMKREGFAKSVKALSDHDIQQGFADSQGMKFLTDPVYRYTSLNMSEHQVNIQAWQFYIKHIIKEVSNAINSQENMTIKKILQRDLETLNKYRTKVFHSDGALDFFKSLLSIHSEKKTQIDKCWNQLTAFSDQFTPSTLDLLKSAARDLLGMNIGLTRTSLQHVEDFKKNLQIITFEIEKDKKARHEFKLYSEFTIYRTTDRKVKSVEDKNMMDTIFQCAERFDEWMKLYTRPKRTDNNNLIVWLSADNGAEYIKDYKQFCNLAATLHIRGYLTDPPPSRSDFELGFLEYTKRLGKLL